jgi:hypothetical protein
MAATYMITGVDKSQTGSYDTYFDDKSSVQNSYNYAYLGIPTGSTNPTSSYFTWPVGSRSNSTLKTLQMYTPFPTGTERGKLYWVTASIYITDPNLPNKEGWVDLPSPSGDQYYIITPSLNNSSLGSGFHIAQYSFIDETDLFDNGWKSQRGTPDSSNALASEATWYSLVNDPSWVSLGLDPNVTGGKAQIVANLLAYTNTSHTLQQSLGLSDANLIKGAIIAAGKTTPFSNDTYKGIVPLFG